METIGANRITYDYVSVDDTTFTSEVLTIDKIVVRCAEALRRRGSSC